MYANNGEHLLLLFIIVHFGRYSFYFSVYILCSLTNLRLAVKYSYYLF